MSYKIALYLLTFSTIFLFLLILRYHVILNKKNLKLIQLYLDSRFIRKGIMDNLSTTDNSVFCKKLIIDIKLYYNLEQIFIIDSLQMKEKSVTSRIEIEICNHISNRVRQINKTLKYNRIYISNLYIVAEDGEYILYITPISMDKTSDGYIVCIEKAPSLLDEHEIMSLETAINLLKTRLLYDS